MNPMKYIIFNEQLIENERNHRCIFFQLFSKRIVKDGKPSHWFLELNEYGKVEREISFDLNGKILSKAPYLKNRGEWVDSNVTFNSFEYSEIDSSVFNQHWNML